MRAGHPALQSETLRLIGQLLDMTRQRIIGFVAMQVDHQPALGRNFAQFGDGTCAVSHGALEMRMPPTMSTPMSSARMVFWRAVGER